MASGVTKMVVICNMHMDVRLIDTTEHNLEVKSDTRVHHHCRLLIFRAIALVLLNENKKRVCCLVSISLVFLINTYCILHCILLMRT